MFWRALSAQALTPFECAPLLLERALAYNMIGARAILLKKWKAAHTYVCTTGNAVSFVNVLHQLAINEDVFNVRVL